MRENRDARSIPAADQEQLRRKAIEAVESGAKQGEVARLYGVTRQAVAKWVKAYRQGGSKALRTKRQGRPRGRGGRLRPWQVAHLVRTIIEQLPDQLNLGDALWTRENVALLVRRQFGVRLSRWTVGRYLVRWGLGVQKFRHYVLRNRSGHFEKQYAQIRRWARRERARIYWGAVVEVRVESLGGDRTEAEGRITLADAQPFAGCVISAMNNRGLLKFLVADEPLRTEALLDFLDRLVRHSPHKMFLVVERHPLYREERVQTWLAQNARSIRLFFLPDDGEEEGLKKIREAS